MAPNVIRVLPMNDYTVQVFLAMARLCAMM